MVEVLHLSLLGLALWRWALLAVAVVAVAVMDTLQHHHSTSIFRTTPKTGFWGPAQYAWLRRYEGRDPARGLRGYLRSPIAQVVIYPFHDGWHLAKTVALVSLIGAIATTWTSALALWVGYYVVFTLFYKQLLRRPRIAE
ncbi:MAG: hypothetical protein AAGN64_04020 [Bacteroidota bacterium]